MMRRRPQPMVFLLAFCVFTVHPVLVQREALAGSSIQVTFQLNDAFVRDLELPGVAVEVRRPSEGAPVATGVTDMSGRLVVRLEPGAYEVSYALAGYVPIEGSLTELNRNGQLVTTSLSPLLEAQAGVAPSGGAVPPVRRIQIVLNWGSDADQVRDADSHLICACDPNSEVYYAAKEHMRRDHAASLDVDDVDWGGPETITLVNPPPGRHQYWVHDYSGPPALLGESDVVVRVLVDNSIAGEFRVPEDFSERDWYPFAWIEVGTDGRAHIEPATSRVIPSKQASPEGAGCLSGCATRPVTNKPVLAALVLVLVVLVLRRGSASASSMGSRPRRR